MTTITPAQRSVIASQANHVVNAGRAIKHGLQVGGKAAGDRTKDSELDAAAALIQLEGALSLLKLVLEDGAGRRILGRPVDSRSKARAVNQPGGRHRA